MPMATELVDGVIENVKTAGLEATMAQIRAAYVADRLGEAQTQLSGAITFTVQDWESVEAFFATGVSSTAVYPLKSAIDAKIAANDATGLGAMLLAFFAAGKAHLG